jgi:uncharacterized glyoxalase superfamily protein PhnB
MAEQTYNPVITPTVMYQDPLAAMKWLENAFDFETITLVTYEDGKVGHAEMTYRGAVIGIAGEWEARILGDAKMRSPKTTGGVATQFLWISLPTGIDEHCAKARAAGAIITQSPEDQFYGSRTYRAHDLEGHVWCFRQFVRTVPQAEMEKGMPGLKWQDPKKG